MESEVLLGGRKKKGKWKSHQLGHAVFPKIKRQSSLLNMRQKLTPHPGCVGSG